MSEFGQTVRPTKLGVLCLRRIDEILLNSHNFVELREQLFSTEISKSFLYHSSG